MAESGLEHGRGRNLWLWMTEGAGAAEIGWGQPDDYDRCLAVMGPHVPADEVHGLCATAHIRVTGMTTAEHKHLEGR